MKDLNDFFKAIALGDKPSRDLVLEFLHLEQTQAVQLILSYKGKLIERGLKEATINRRIAAINARLQLFSGLHLEANYKGGVSVRDRILRAEKVAARILQQLHDTPHTRCVEPVADFVQTPVPVTAMVR